MTASMDLQAARLLPATRLQWPRVAALFLFAFAAALLASSLVDTSSRARSEVAQVVTST